MQKNYRVVAAPANCQFNFVIVDQADRTHGYCSDRTVAERHATRWSREGR